MHHCTSLETILPVWFIVIFTRILVVADAVFFPGLISGQLKAFGKCKTKAVTMAVMLQHAQWYGCSQLGPEICLMNKIEVRFGFTS